MEEQTSATVCLSAAGRGGEDDDVYAARDEEPHMNMAAEWGGVGVKGEQMVFCHLRGRAEWRQTEGTSVF